jgi:hypothetical protein
MLQPATRVGLLLIAATTVVLTFFTDAGWAAPDTPGPPSIPSQPIPPPDAAQASPSTEILSPAAAADAQHYVVSVTAIADTFLDVANPSTNYGGQQKVRVSGEAGAQASSLFRFNLTGVLPSTAQVFSATLSLHHTDPHDFLIMAWPHAITSAWNEYTVTANTAPSSSYRGDAPVWLDVSGWQKIPVTEIVRAWVAGEVTNHGIALAPYMYQGYRSFQSRESDCDPVLTVAYTVREAFGVTMDTYVDKQQASTNFGSDLFVRVAGGTPAVERQTLLWFDLSSIPEDVAVVNATLRLYHWLNKAGEDADAAEELRQPVGGAALYADAIAADPNWTEMGVTWNNRPGSAYLDDPPTEWVMNGWTVFDVTNIVRQWLEEGMENDGILLRAEASSAVYSSFYSRQWYDPGSDPALIIDYGPLPPPPCIPVTDAYISGPTAGQPGEVYHFSGTISPAGAGPVISTGWTAQGQTGTQPGNEVDYSWATPGQRQITYAVEHCAGTTYAYHFINIQEPPPECDVAVSSLSVVGPLIVPTGGSNQFTAEAGPPGATRPITFYWTATEQSAATFSGTSLTSNINYTWAQAGTKLVNVTVENCSGAAVAHRQVQVVAPSLLPDLVVTAGWYDKTGNKAYAVIENTGQTAAPGEHYVELNVDGSTAQYLLMGKRLEPGAVTVLGIPYTLSCSGDAVVRIIVDASNLIAEIDETNNTFEDTWLCDRSPPTIISGPTVTDITERRAIVSFETDEECRGWVQYGWMSNVAPEVAESPDPHTRHAILLENLDSGHTYHYQAFCQDRYENTVNSVYLTFQTHPPGSDPPTVMGATISPWYNNSLYEYYVLVAQMRNDDTVK